MNLLFKRFHSNFDLVNYGATVYAIVHGVPWYIAVSFSIMVDIAGYAATHYFTKE